MWCISFTAIPTMKFKDIVDVDSLQQECTRRNLPIHVASMLGDKCIGDYMFGGGCDLAECPHVSPIVTGMYFGYPLETSLDIMM